MAAIWQVVWRWTGFTGAPGYTNLFFASTTGDATEALAAATKSRIFFAGLPAQLPGSVRIDLQTDVRLIEDTTGDLLDIFTVSGLTQVVGSGNAIFAGPSGGVVNWITTTVHGGRRMMGRTYVVPLTNLAYDTDGSLGGTVVTALATAAEAMRTATGPVFGVWGRPRAADPLHVPPITARAGLWGPATSSRVVDKAAVLTSRRD